MWWCTVLGSLEMIQPRRVERRVLGRPTAPRLLVVQLRSGTWTIVFTDLVGSTPQRTRIGDVAADALRREHDRILADAVAQHGGMIIKGTGDGAMVAFAGAAGALAAAVAVQQRIERRNRTAVEPLQLRVGISIGDVVYEDGDLHGTAVVEAQRICATADAGEVLLSAMVRSIAGSRAEITLVATGPRNLKGLPEPVDIWRAEWSELDQAALPFPALLAPDEQLAFGGRAAELGRLLDIWKEVLGGNRRAVFVSGEPGIGKTRLAAEVARVAYTERAVVLYGCCDEGLNMPHQPFVEALDFYLARADHVEVGSHPGELSRVSARVRTRVPRAPEPIPGDPDVEQYSLFEAISSWLATLAEHSPVVLVVDDVHWASRPTVLMLRHILRTVSEEPLLLIATYRDTDLDESDPLSWALADLRSLAGVERLPLIGLDEAGVVELLERVSEQDADASLRALARHLHAETEGNPLFIREVLRHLAESGRLEQRDGRWTSATDAGDFGMPEGVSEVIGQRLQRLGPHATEVLQIASCIGRDFPIDILVGAGGRDEDMVLDVVDRAVSARLIEEAEQQYRFTHALVRSALLERLGAARRMQLHRRIAEELEARQPHNIIALAYQWCEASTAGDARRAIDYAHRAADSATQQAAFDEAVALLERAATIAAEASVDDDAASRLWIALGDARMTAGRVEAARDAYVEAATHLPDGAAELVHIALNFHGPSRAGPQDDRHAILGHRALAAVDERRDPATAARLHAQLSLMHDKWAPAQLDEAERAVELALRSGDRGALCDAYRARFWTAEPGRSSEYAEASLSAARDVASNDVLLNTFIVAMIAAGQRGDYERFATLAREHAQLAEDSRLPIARGLSRCIGARMRVTRAELAAAESLANEARDHGGPDGRAQLGRHPPEPAAHEGTPRRSRRDDSVVVRRRLDTGERAAFQRGFPRTATRRRGTGRAGANPVRRPGRQRLRTRERPSQSVAHRGARGAERPVRSARRPSARGAADQPAAALGARASASERVRGLRPHRAPPGPSRVPCRSPRRGGRASRALTRRDDRRRSILEGVRIEAGAGAGVARARRGSASPRHARRSPNGRAAGRVATPRAAR